MPSFAVIFFCVGQRNSKVELDGTMCHKTKRTHAADMPSLHERAQLRASSFSVHVSVQDYYSVLGVSKNAEKGEIKSGM